MIENRVLSLPSISTFGLSHQKAGICCPLQVAIYMRSDGKTPMGSGFSRLWMGDFDFSR